MRELNAAIRDIPRPPSMVALPISDRGYPVPWFVYWDEGKPDFRVVGPGKRGLAYKKSLCWVCGGKLGRLKATVIGPMCAVNRVSSEPPSHPPCARYAAIACPFLANPRMRRNEKELPEGRTVPGVSLDRNPGVAAVWLSLRRSKPFPDGHGDYLFELGEPERVEWYAQGRTATRKECDASIRSGLPFLRAEAAKEGEEAILALGQYMHAALALLPAA